MATQYANELIGLGQTPVVKPEAARGVNAPVYRFRASFTATVVSTWGNSDKVIVAVIPAGYIPAFLMAMPGSINSLVFNFAEGDVTAQIGATGMFDFKTQKLTTRDTTVTTTVGTINLLLSMGDASFDIYCSAPN